MRSQQAVKASRGEQEWDPGRADLWGVEQTGSCVQAREARTLSRVPLSRAVCLRTFSATFSLTELKQGPGSHLNSQVLSVHILRGRQVYRDKACLSPSLPPLSTLEMVILSQQSYGQAHLCASQMSQRKEFPRLCLP